MTREIDWAPAVLLKILFAEWLKVTANGCSYFKCTAASTAFGPGDPCSRGFATTAHISA